VADAIKYLTRNKLDMFYRCEKCGEILRERNEFSFKYQRGFLTFNNQSFSFCLSITNLDMNAMDKKI